MKLIHTKNYLFLIDEHAEIKTGDYILEKESIINIFPNYLTDLDECIKIIAYYPLTKEAKELDLPLLPNPFEKVDVERLAREYSKGKSSSDVFKEAHEKDFIAGYKAGQSDKQFSLDDIKKAALMAKEKYEKGGKELATYSVNTIVEFFSTQKIPTEFIPEYIYESECSCSRLGYKPMLKGCTERNGCLIALKTIINSQGKTELVGSYKY